MPAFEGYEGAETIDVDGTWAYGSVEEGYYSWYQITALDGVRFYKITLQARTQSKPMRCYMYDSKGAGMIKELTASGTSVSRSNSTYVKLTAGETYYICVYPVSTSAIGAGYGLAVDNEVDLEGDDISTAADYNLGESVTGHLIDYRGSEDTVHDEDYFRFQTDSTGGSYELKAMNISYKGNSGSTGTIKVQILEQGGIPVDDEEMSVNSKEKTKSYELNKDTTYYVYVYGVGNGLGTIDGDYSFSVTKTGGASDPVDPEDPVEPEPVEEDCTVTFNTAGGSSVDPQKVEKGLTVTRPEDPTKEGYTFAGWYADASYSEKYDFDNPVNGDITLFAKWEENEPEPEPEEKLESEITASRTVLKAKTLKKKSQKVEILVKGSDGQVTIVDETNSAKLSKKVSISGDTITFRKKAKKGTYVFKVTSAASGNYKETVKLVTIYVK